MMHRSAQRDIRWSLLFAVAATALPAIALAQTAPPAATNYGLDSLSEQKVMTELASRRLDDLLDRLFDVEKVSETERDGIRTLIASNELNDPANKLSAKERAELITKIIKGIDVALPNLNDPNLLMQLANTLINESVLQNANTLEFWGDDPSLQASLKPIADTVVKLLQAAITRADEQATDVGNRIKGPDDTRLIKEYDSLSNLKGSAEFALQLSEYFRVLAMDKADPERGKIATDAIKALKEQDNADSFVQPTARMGIAQLMLQRGQDTDYADAKALFDSIWKTPDQIKPAPTNQQQYRAAYFSADADLFAGKLDDADAGLKALRDWDGQHIPADDAAWKSTASAGAALLEYRIYSARATAATDATAKNKFASQAVDTLLQLVREQPAFKGAIAPLLLQKLPENADVKTLDPLLLQAVMTRGEMETKKPEGEARDTKTMERAVAACDELIRRGASAGIKPDDIANASLLTAFLLEKLNKPVDAASGYLGFVEKNRNNRNAALALDNGKALIADMMKGKPPSAIDPQTRALYGRALAISFNAPFNQTEVAYAYGRYLFDQGASTEAARVLAAVPGTDPQALMARYFQMLSSKDAVDKDTKLTDDKKKQLLADVQRLANEVNAGAQKEVAGAVDEKTKARFRSLTVKTSLLAADVSTRYDKNPKRTLELLKNFEDQVKGVSNDQQLLAEALYIRVDAYMELGQVPQAANELLALLDKTGGDQGANLIYKVLTQLDQNFQAAKKAGNKEEVAKLAAARAELSGRLVAWATSKQMDEKTVNQYRLFDAASKQQAAAVTEDPQQRDQFLNDSLKGFKEMLGKGMDDAVNLGIASVNFDLGNYAEAQALYSKLLADRKLGTAQDYQGENLVDNPQYWEASYKLNRSVAELGKSNPAMLNDAKVSLTRLYLIYGPGVGGKLWHDEFEKLRKEIIPDFNPNAINATTEPTQK